MLKMPKYVKWKGFIVVNYEGETQVHDIDLDLWDNVADAGTYFEFVDKDEDCDDIYPEKLAIKYKGGDDETDFISYDNYGLRMREDRDYSSDALNRVSIFDYIICREYYSPHQEGDDWEEAPTATCDRDYHDLRKFGAANPGVYFVTDDLKKSLSLYFSRKPDEQVAGKTCKVYVTNYGGASHTYFIWKKVIMREVGENGEIMNEVLAITEDVPASAFTKTATHGWIK
jgi:hypothetical protein